VLEDADPSIVAPALHSLAEDAEEALPRLIKALENKKARFWVVRILEEMGPKARTAVPALYDQLSDENPEIRMHALIALGKIGADTKAIGMKALDLLLNDPSPAVRYSAAYAIVQLRPVGSVEALRTTAQSDDEFLKMLSMWGLAMLNPSDTEQMKKAVELLVQGMESDLPHVRAAAARGLVQLDAPKEIARPYILAAFRKADPVIIANVIDAVSGLGAEAVPKVVRVIEEEPILRIPALRVIQRIGPEAADAVPALVDILKQGDPKSEDDDDLNRAAVEALAAIGPKAEEAVDPMLEIFKDPAKKDLRYGAGYVLGSIGPAAAKAAPALEAALQSDDPFLKLVSAWALVQVKPDSQAAADKALPILLAGLDHERADVRVEVIRSLASIKQHAERIRPKLQEALKDPKPEVRAAASQALKMLGMG